MDSRRAMTAIPAGAERRLPELVHGDVERGLEHGVLGDSRRA
jgi:hypothetical protein